MAGIVGLQEAESVYQQMVKIGLTKALMGLGILTGMIMTLYKVIKNYWEAMAEGEKLDVKKLLGFFTPYVKYMLLILALPFIISFVEHLFAQMEGLILGKVGVQPALDGFIEQARKEEEFLTKEVGTLGLTLDPSIWISYLGVIVIRPIMILIDNYLFSFALCGRYFYLILLEIVAPICICGLLYEKTEEWFWSWIKNLMCCYLLLPGFMIANYFAEAMFVVFFHNGEYGGSELLVIIALKIYLFKQSASRIFQLIK